MLFEILELVTLSAMFMGLLILWVLYLVALEPVHGDSGQLDTHPASDYDHELNIGLTSIYPFDDLEALHSP